MIQPFQQKPAKRLTYKERVKAGMVKSKPSSRIQPVAKRKQADRKKYSEWVKIAMHGVVRCEKCRTRSHPLEPHHPHGRYGENLFKVIPLCKLCHLWVHQFPNAAYAMGYLQPEYRGLPHNPDHPVPFKLLTPP